MQNDFDDVVRRGSNKVTTLLTKEHKFKDLKAVSFVKGV
jgi:hypothetical protein